MENNFFLNFAESIHKFIEVLKDSEVEEKCYVTLRCETAQTPSTVTWLKGHTVLKAGGRYEMSQKEGVLTLTIKHLGENDTDVYICDVGTAKSMAKVTVNGKKLYACVCMMYLFDVLVQNRFFLCSLFEKLLKY